MGMKDTLQRVRWYIEVWCGFYFTFVCSRADVFSAGDELLSVFYPQLRYCPSYSSNQIWGSWIWNWCDFYTSFGQLPVWSRIWLLPNTSCDRCNVGFSTLEFPFSFLDIPMPLFHLKIKCQYLHFPFWYYIRLITWKCFEIIYRHHLLLVFFFLSGFVPHVSEGWIRWKSSL